MISNVWTCAHCQQSQTKPALFTTEDADYCSQACMEAGRRDNEVSQMTVYFADRMRVFEGMREADCQPVIREPLGELERLREENTQLKAVLGAVYEAYVREWWNRSELGLGDEEIERMQARASMLAARIVEVSKND